MIPRLSLLIVASLGLGCVPARSTTRPRDITWYRTRASERTRDPGAQRDRALAELVAPGGDASLGATVIERLGESRPGDVRVRFARAIVRSQHGDFEGALTDYVGALRAARDTNDPIGSAIAEATVPRLIELRGNVRDIAAPLRAIVDAVIEDPGYLGPAARGALLDGAVRWARERGEHDLTVRWTAAAGCVTAWTVAGPFGPHPMLRFDETHPPASTLPFAAAYDLGPGRGVHATYNVRARGCAANLGRGVTLTGVFYAATDLRVSQDTEAHIRVESPNTYSVLLDGITIATIDPRVRAVGTITNTAVRLSAGVHTLRIKVASTYHAPLLIAMVTDRNGRPIARFSEAHAPSNVVAPEVIATRPSPADDAYTPNARASLDPFARYVLAELAFARRHPIAARELLRPLAMQNDATAQTLIAWASVALADPFLPPGMARDRARHALEEAARRDAGAYYPALQLARLTWNDERPDEALTMLRSAAQRFDENPELEAELADRLMQRNADGEARAILERARTRLPNACWPSRMLLSLAQRHGDGQTELALAREIRHCDALSDAAAATLSRLRRWGEAENEYLRLVADDPEGRGLRRSLVELARARGAHSDAVERAVALLADMPEDDALRADLVDLLVARGAVGDASALLDRELARSPSELAGLYRMRAALRRRDDLEPWRLDGRRVLADFEGSRRSYDGAAVLVLDYTVRRNFLDGSALELTHNVVRVQSQEGVEQYGEFSPPAGATVYRVRTLKADGRALEPEQIAGKESLSFPDLRPGDAIEFEYVRAIPSAELAPGGFIGDRFYFRGFDVPYDRSEYVVVTPLAQPLVIDPRGAAPTVTRDEHHGLTVYRWVARESDRLVQEPRTVSQREYLPSVAVGVNGTWRHFVDALRERLIDRDVVDPEAQALVRELTAGANTASERVRRVHGWVLDHIEQEGAGTPFDIAPRMLAARQGHRTRVLRYLLGLAGIRCEMALVRPGAADATPSELADDNTYQSIMLRAHTERGPVWITAADHNAPMRYIPPGLAGAEALLLDANATRERLPALDLDQHGRSLRVQLTLAADGSGHAVVEERLRGYAATGARQVVRRMDAANRERQFEAYVGGMVAGASLESLAITGTDDREADMVFRYAFRAPGMAIPSGSGLVFEGLFHAEAARIYAETQERSVSLWNGDPVRATLDLTVTLPDGAHVEGADYDEHGEAPGIRWSIRSTRNARGFHVERRVDIPTGRVRASDYSAFASQARALDAADSRRVQINTSP